MKRNQTKRLQYKYYFCFVVMLILCCFCTPSGMGKNKIAKGFIKTRKEIFFSAGQNPPFAQRRPDMSFLIYDEQTLDMEGYLKQLKAYMEKYKNNSF